MSDAAILAPIASIAGPLVAAILAQTDPSGFLTLEGVTVAGVLVFVIVSLIVGWLELGRIANSLRSENEALKAEIKDKDTEIRDLGNDSVNAVREASARNNNIEYQLSVLLTSLHDLEKTGSLVLSLLSSGEASARGRKEEG